MTEAAESRKVTHVAVGVLWRDDGRVLLADRPAGKPYAGYWEFPGGKVEPGEPVTAALQRELREELGIEIGSSTSWVTFEFDYPHAYVRLYFHRIRRWSGEPQGREGQRFLFIDPTAELPQPLLPAAIPALRWLGLPLTAVFVRREALSRYAADDRRDHRPAGALSSRLLVVDGDWRLAGAASAARIAADTVGRRDVLIAVGPAAAQAAGVDGALLDARTRESARRRPDGRWLGYWADTECELQRAVGDGCDFAVVRSPTLAATMLDRVPALPVYLPASIAAMSADCDGAGHGRWFDRR